MEKLKQKGVETFLFIMAIFGGFRVVFSQFTLNNNFGPYAITAVQLLIGGSILACYLRGKIFSINKRYLTIAILTSLVFFATLYLSTLGLVYTTPSKNIFLSQTSMIFIPFLYFFVYKQKIDIYTITGVVIAMIGLAVLTLDNGFGNMNSGDLLTVLAAFLIAIHMTFSSYIIKKNECDPVVFMAIQMLVSGMLALVLALFVNDFSENRSFTSIWPLLMGGVLTGLNFYVNSLAFKYSTPTKMSIIYSIIPVSGTVASILFLDEVITFRLFVGAGLIMIALLIIQLKPKVTKFIYDMNEKESIDNLTN